MAKNTDPKYRKNVYNALKGELGDSFGKTESEFYSSLDNEEGYASKVFTALKGELGDSFNKSEDEFYSLVLKKKETTTSTSDVSPLATSNQKAVTSSVSPTEEKTELQKFQSQLGTSLSKVAEGTKLRQPTELDDYRAQREGNAPPESEKRISGNVDFYNAKQTPTQEVNLNEGRLPSTTKTTGVINPNENKGLFNQEDKPKYRLPKESQEEVDTSDLYSTSGNLDPTEFNEKTRQEISNKARENDLDLENPYLYYYNQKAEEDYFVEEEFAQDKLLKLGVDPQDFEGYLIKKGLKSDYQSKKERGLFDSQAFNFKGERIGALGQDMDKFKLLSMYMQDKNNRMRDASVLMKGLEDPTAYSLNQIERPNNTTLFDREQIEQYVMEEMPVLYEVSKKADAKNEEILRKHRDGETGFFYGGEKMLESGFNALVDRASGFAATGYDFLGADDSADTIRMLLNTQEISKPNTREYVSVSGKVVEKNGERYIIDSRGDVYDSEKKIRITDTFTKVGELENILQLAKESKESDTSYSTQGFFIQASGVVTDLAFQIALTRGVSGTLGTAIRGTATLGKIGVGGLNASTKTLLAVENLGGSAIAQSAMGYSSGLEDTLALAKEQGLTDDDAMRLGNDIATRMAVVYGVTSFLSPQIKAKEAIFGSGNKQMIAKAFEAFKRGGDKAYKKSINESFKALSNKVPKAVVEFTEEGGKEVIQENIQQLSETKLINPAINRGVGSEVRQEEMTKDDFMNTSILSFFSSGLMSQLKFSTMFKKNAPDRLQMVRRLGEDMVDFENALAPLLSEGGMSEEFANELRKDVNNFNKQANNIPQDLDPEVALSVMDDLQNIQDLEDKKRKLDPVFSKPYDAQIARIRENINKKSEFSELSQDEKINAKEQASIELTNEKLSQGQKQEDIFLTDREITNRAVENTIQEKTEQEQAFEVIDDISVEDNYFDPLESEEEALARLKQGLEGLEGQELDEAIERVAEQHTASYNEYIASQGDADVINSDFAKNFKQNAIEALNPQTTQQEQVTVVDGEVNNTKGTILEDVVGKQYEYTDPITNETLVGEIFFDGQEVVFTNGNKEHSLGFINDVVDSGELNATEVQPNFNIDANGEISYEGESFGKGKITLQQGGLKSIKTDKNGNIKRIVVTDSEGNTRSIKGEEANELAELLLLERSLNGELQSKITTDGDTRTKLEQAVNRATVEVAESKANRDTQEDISGRDGTRADRSAEEGSRVDEDGIQVSEKEFLEDQNKLDTVEQTEVENIELSKTKDNINNSPIADRDQNNQDLVRYIPFQVVEEANKNDTISGQNAKQISDRGGYSVLELDRILPNWREKVLDINKSTQLEENTNQPPQAVSEPKGQTIEKTKTKKPRVFETNVNRYTAELIDGKLKITPLIGKATPSDAEIKKVTELYSEQLDFEQGKRANLEDTQNSTTEEISDIVAAESENANEIATQIVAQRESAEIDTEVSKSKLGAIAQALIGIQVDINSFFQNGDRNKVKDVNPYYFNANNKNRKETLDGIRETAQQYTNEEVEIENIVNFLYEHRNPTEFLESETSNTSKLEARFEEITGLKATNENIEKALGKPTEEVDNSDVPFQSQSTQIKIAGKALFDLVDRLKKSGLARKVIFLNDTQTKSRLDEIGRKFINTPNSFVANGIVYINTDKVKSDSPIHEFGHLWNEYAKENNPDVYKRGIELIENTDYFIDIQNNKEYDGLSKEQKLEEALAQAIGDKGVKIMNEANKSKFAGWFNVLFKRIADGLGIRSLSGTKLAELTLSQYTDLVSAELLSKKPIDNKLEKEAKTKVVSDASNNIDSVIAVQEAISKTRNKIQDKINDKKSEVESIRKLLLDYIAQNTNRKNVKEILPSQITSLINTVNKASTLRGMNNAITKIDKIVDKMNKAEFTSHYEAMKARALAKQEVANKKATDKSKEKAIKEYRNKAIDKKWLSNINITDIDNMNKAIDLAIERSLEDGIAKIDEVAQKMEERYNKAQEQAIAKAERDQQKREEQISYIVAKNKAQRDVITKRFADKKQSAKDIRKALIIYLKEQISSKRFDRVTRGEFNSLLNAVRNTETEKQLDKQFQKINDLIDRLDAEIISDKINEIVNRNLTVVQSGRQKANILSEARATVLESFRDNIKGLVTKRKPTSKKWETINTKIAELFDIRDELDKIKTPTEEQQWQYEAVSLSIDALTAYNSGNNTIRKNILAEVLNSVDLIYETGRSELADARQRVRDNYDNLRDGIDLDTNPKRLKQSKSEADIQEERSTFNAVLARIYFISTKRYLIGSLDRLSTVLSRKGAENRNDSAWVQYTNNAKRLETFKDRRIDAKSESVKAARERYFGTIKKADIALNTRYEINTYADDLEEGADRGIVKSKYTADQLLVVYKNSKNPDLKARYEEHTFVSVDEIDSLLPQSVKDYAEWQSNDFYIDSWNEENEVYRAMNHHSMGNEDNYIGKVYSSDIDYKEDTEALNKGKGTLNTTAHGSQKLRVKNNNPILIVASSFLLSKNIHDTSHYIAYAEFHRDYKKLINDKKIKNAINVTNPKTGDLAISFLNYYNEIIFEKGNSRGVAVVNSLAKNINKATLALKTKIGVTQTMSMLNTAVDMPPNLSEAKFLSYYVDFRRNARTYKYIVENSEYINKRYGSAGFDQAITGLTDLARQPYFKTGNLTVDANRKQIARYYNESLDLAMINVKLGDKVGVMGGIPIYNAWYDVYIKTESPEAAAKKAMEQFESSTDRSQQTLSAFGKSMVQNDPVGRYFAMFATAPIQNQQNAMYHYNEITRGIRGEGMKGSYRRNVAGFLNYQIVQPVLYTYIASILAGNLFTALGFGDDEPDDVDKSLLSAFLLGNISSIPFIGGLIQGIVERGILKMDRSFAKIATSALLSNVDKLDEDWEKVYSAKTKYEKVEATKKAIKTSASLFAGFPQFATDAVLDWEKTYWNSEVDGSVKFRKGLGYSDYVIDSARKERGLREDAEQVLLNKEEAYEDSVYDYEDTKEARKTKASFRKDFEFNRGFLNKSK